jgi:hypothetical protein
MAKIFKSQLTLKYNNEIYDAEFELVRSLKYRKNNLIYCTILLIFSLVNLIYTSKIREEKIHFESYYNRFTSYLITVIYIPILVLIFKYENSKFQRNVLYLIYYLSLFTFISQRLFLEYVNNIDSVIFPMIFTFEQIFRITWIFSSSLNFIEVLLLNVAISVSTVSYSFYVIPNGYKYREFIYVGVYLMISLTTYFFILEQRKSFYYNKALEYQNSWYLNIIDNMNQIAGSNYNNNNNENIFNVKRKKFN